MEHKKAELKLLDMEHTLAGENAETYAKKYDRTLLLLKKRAQTAVDGGMEQKEYAKAQVLLDAVDTARKIIKLTSMKK
ncbi:MAG: hypothetical protein IKP87_02760 [Victivallales bacterium]|nr:hypothetical protein [Victivallales bacterium]